MNALLHTYVVVGALLAEVLVEGRVLRSAGLHPYYSPFAYVDVCISLGYMCFTLPWSVRTWFVLRHREHTSRSLMLHHVCVVVAELVYLLTQARMQPTHATHACNPHSIIILPSIIRA